MYNEHNMENPGNQDMQQDTQERSTTAVLGIISVVVISVVLVGIVLFARGRVAENGSQEEPSFDQVETSVITGKIGLSHKNQAQTYRNGQTVTLFVYADTKDQKITAYDAVLTYDSEQLRFDSVSNIVDGIDLAETNRILDDGTGELVITGVQSLSKKEAFIFNNTALAEVTFTIVGSGPINVGLDYEPGGTAESNLMTLRNEDILSNVAGTIIDVR